MKNNSVYYQTLKRVFSFMATCTDQLNRLLAFSVFQNVVQQGSTMAVFVAEKRLKRPELRFLEQSKQ